MFSHVERAHSVSVLQITTNKLVKRFTHSGANVALSITGVFVW